MPCWRIIACAALLIPAAARPGTIRYRYDDAGQLVRADYGGGRTVDYTYDAAGHLLERLVRAGALPQADLALLKLGAPTAFELGRGNLVYTLAVSNTGPDTAQDVQVTDTLPVQVLFASASTGALQEGIFTAQLGDLPTGVRLDIRLEVVPLATGEIVNLATVAGSDDDPQPANNTAVTTNLVFAAADTNENGLADWWEQFYFTNAADRVAWGDFDGDGDNNLREQTAGTDPTQSNSFFHIAGFSDRTLVFRGESGRVYAVSWNSNGLASIWPVLASHLPGFGQAISVTDTQRVSRGVYRAESTLPQP